MSEHSKKLYAFAAFLGLVERDNKDDPFHQVVYGVTQKTSVKNLTEQEAERVKKELIKKVGFIEPATTAQKKYIFGLAKKLEECDKTMLEPSLNEWLAGMIKKTLNVTVDAESPLKKISKTDASKLIVVLKKCLENKQKAGNKK